MVDAETGVARPGAGGVVPEGVEPLLVGVERAQRVGPALVDDAAEGGLAFGLEQRVIGHRPAREGVAVLGNDVEVAGQHRRPLLGKDCGGPLAEPIHPA